MLKNPYNKDSLTAKFSNSYPLVYEIFIISI